MGPWGNPARVGTGDRERDGGAGMGCLDDNTENIYKEYLFPQILRWNIPDILNLYKQEKGPENEKLASADDYDVIFDVIHFPLHISFLFY